jgi:hypothetical protein
MKCNNKFCIWCSFEQCCHESEEGHKNATPNQLDCPSSIRVDFEEQLYNLIDEIIDLLKHRNMKELNKIKKFIINQRLTDAVAISLNRTEKLEQLLRDVLASGNVTACRKEIERVFEGYKINY